MKHVISQQAASAPQQIGNTGATAEPAADIALDVVEPDHVGVLNGFYRCGAVATTLAGAAATIVPAWLSPRERPSTGSCVLVRIDETDAELTMPRSLIDALIESVDRQLSLDGIAAETAAMVLELALNDALVAVESCLGCRLALVSVGPKRPDAIAAEWVTLAFKAEIDGLGSSICELSLAAEDAWRLLQGLERCAGAAGDIAPPIAVSLRAAATTLSVGALGRLVPGDVVLADMESRPDGTAIAVIGDHLVAPAEVGPTGGLLSARPVAGRGSPWEWSMDNRNEGTEAVALEDSELDDLPVRIVFELGRVELPLGEIRRLARGAVIPLARAFDEPLDIVANGRRLGRGALVRIGQNLGVRIVSLVGND